MLLMPYLWCEGFSKLDFDLFFSNTILFILLLIFIYEKKCCCLVNIKISATPQWERAVDSNSSDVHAAAVGVAARRMCLYGLH